MPKFAFNKITSIKGRDNFYKLYKNSGCSLLDFEREIKSRTTYAGELAALYSYMEFVADGSKLPVTKFKDITPAKEMVKEYEFKSKHLRIYLIRFKDGKLLVIGGYKKTQKRDILKFRKIKKQLLESKQDIVRLPDDYDEKEELK